MPLCHLTLLICWIWNVLHGHVSFEDGPTAHRLAVSRALPVTYFWRLFSCRLAPVPWLSAKEDFFDSTGSSQGSHGFWGVTAS